MRQTTSGDMGIDPLAGTEVSVLLVPVDSIDGHHFRQSALRDDNALQQLFRRSQRLQLQMLHLRRLVAHDRRHHHLVIAVNCLLAVGIPLAFLARPRRGIAAAANGFRFGGSRPACLSAVIASSGAALAFAAAARGSWPCWRWPLTWCHQGSRAPSSPCLLSGAAAGSERTDLLCIEVAASDVADPAVIGLLIAGEHPESKLIVASPLDFEGGDCAHAVGIEQQHGEHVRGKPLLTFGILGLSGD